MNEHDKLLKEIAAVDFAVIETGLYLDTHPDCKAAVQYMQRCSEMAKALKAKYEAKYGPLFITGNKSDCCWEWASNPWPWDYDGGAC